MLGGAGNVASNIASLGATAILIGLVGADEAGARLQSIVAGSGTIRSALIPKPPTAPPSARPASSPAASKSCAPTRKAAPPSTRTRRIALIAALDAHLPAADAVIFSDYGKGALSPALLAHGIAKPPARAASRSSSTPNPDDFTRYRGATCITPNAREMAAAARAPRHRGRHRHRRPPP